MEECTELLTRGENKKGNLDLYNFLVIFFFKLV